MAHVNQDDDRTVPIDFTKADPSTRPIPVVADRSVVPAAPQVAPAGWPGPGPTSWTAPQPYPQLQTDQRPASAAVLVIAWVSAAITFGYMLPWAIAATRGRSNQAAIGVVNLLLGWSFIGWVAALVMACQAHATRTMMPVNVVVATQYVAPQPGYAAPGHPTQPYPTPPAPPAAGWYPSPAGAGQEYWDGHTWTGHRAP